MANILVALTFVGAVGAYGYVQWRLGQIHRKDLTALAQAKAHSPAFTVLIVGSDSRSALGSSGAQYGGSSVGGQRSDTIILVRVVPATGQLMMMSIPRDLWVDIPRLGYSRINSAFGLGPNLLIQTIETDLAIPINHYIEVNFNSFQDIADAVGGVKVYFPTPAKDVLSGLYIPKPGCYNLTGAQALAFVRSRHYEYYQGGQWNYEGLSDLARIQRQQWFIKRMISKAKSEFTNPVALNNVVSGLVKNLTVDSHFGTGLMLQLASDFHAIHAGTIPSLTLPNYPFTTAGGAEVLGLQEPQAAETIATFNSFGNTPPKPSAQPAKATTPTATMPPVTVPASSVSVEVANGTGANGQAGALSNALAALGYHPAVQQQSPGYGHATTEVLYAPDSLTAAEQLAAQIPGGATLSEDSGLTPTPYNVEVVTGATYKSGAAPAAGASTTASTPTTTIPGENAITYELPGSTAPPPANCA